MDIIKTALAEGRTTLSEHESISEIDINPIILDGERPVAVDALVILKA